MKKLFLFLLISVSFSYSAVSQTIEYFSNSSYWRMRSICTYGFPCVLINEYGNFVSGDTVVNSIAYNKISTYSVSRAEWQGPEPQNPNCFNADTSLSLNCLVRQDGKKVFVKYGLSEEALMYDYDLQVNDTLPSTSIHPQTDLVVVGVDSILINGEYRKSFQIEGSAQFTLIEGIGTNFGLLESVLPMLECGYNFFCYWENGIPVYFNGDTQVCNQVVGIQNNPSSDLQLFPNPVEGLFYIDGAKKLLSIADFSGRNIQQYSSMGLLNGKLQIDFSGMSSGLYFVTFIDTQGNLNTLKVVKR